MNGNKRVSMICKAQNNTIGNWMSGARFLHQVLDLFCDLIGNTWKLLTKSIVCLFSRFCCFVWSNVSFETKAALTD